MPDVLDFVMELLITKRPQLDVYHTLNEVSVRYKEFPCYNLSHSLRGKNITMTAN